MTTRMTLVVIAIVLTVPHGAMADEGAPPAAVAGILRIDPVTQHSFVAAWVPVTAGMDLAGIRWFNNDEFAAFPQVLALCGGGDELGNVEDCFLLAEGVTGLSSGWSELAFAAPVACGGGGAYIVFQLPEDAAVPAEGAGGGAGIGYISGGGLSHWVSIDGANWVGVDEAFGLALEPVLSAAQGGGTLGAHGGGVALVSSGVETALQSITPNPFNPDTEIQFTLREPTQVSICVYDVSGRLVVKLLNEFLAAGAHAATWNGRNGQGSIAASGVYFVRLSAGAEVFNRRMLLVK